MNINLLDHLFVTRHHPYQVSMGNPLKDVFPLTVVNNDLYETDTYEVRVNI